MKRGKKKEMRNFKKNSWKNEIENNNVARLKKKREIVGKYDSEWPLNGSRISIVAPKMQGDNVGIRIRSS